MIGLLVVEEYSGQPLKEGEVTLNVTEHSVLTIL